MSVCASSTARMARSASRSWRAAAWAARPILGKLIRAFLPQADLLAYLEAILRVYNRHGRRDNIHKARIKILVRALGAEEFTRQVEREFEASREFAPRLEAHEVERMRGFFAPPPYQQLPRGIGGARAAARRPSRPGIATTRADTR